MKMTNAQKRKAFLNAVYVKLGAVETVSRQEILEVIAANKLPYPAWLVNDPAYRAPKRGNYYVNLNKQEPKIMNETVTEDTAIEEVQMAPRAALSVVSGDIANAEAESLIPPKAQGYVPFGHFKDVRTIIASKKFYPMYITGLSGNGKTMMVEQVCAQEKREIIRVNITIETDEDDLIGGFRLIDGRTVWQNGPVIHAMERGAILLTDEVDLGSNKLMCLQPVLEGKPIFIKKINKLVVPKEGFNIVATANTKGKGSDDGRFIGTNVMNEAFLERFSITLEQEYPAESVEAKILNAVLKKSEAEDENFVQMLVKWADLVRKTFAQNGVDEIISTRRLVHICEAYAIFKNREKAIQLCLNRFDGETKNTFMELYKKVDETVNKPAAPVKEEPKESKSDTEYPF